MSDLVSKFTAKFTAMAADGSADTSADVGKCAICGRPATPEYRPFCTRRCADVDLGRWLRGSYAIPVKPSEDDEEDSGVPDEDER
jgi:endogenous inhibitor of DNA gyrase (YacG/DUF329 family)